MAAAGIIYGATVAKALVLLDQAETATVRVPTSFDGRFIVLSVDAKKLRASVAAHERTADLPTKYNMNTRVIEIGSADAIAGTR